MNNLFTKAFKMYDSYTLKNPYKSISISTGIILCTGDILEQFIERRKHKNQKFQVKRALDVGLYGLVIYGPICTIWYNNFLPRIAPLSQKPLLKELFLKIFLDETIESSAFYVTFLYFLTRFEGGNHKDGCHKVKKDFFRCYLADIAIWPVLQYANFRYVPHHLQAIVVSLLTVFWGAYISYVQHSN